MTLDPGGDPAAHRDAAPVPGPQAALARDAVVHALETCDGALAAWEAGSAAFGRADLASDLDVAVLCAPDAATDVLDAIAAALRAVAPELDEWNLGRSLFGMQRFWQPAQPGADAPICLVDVSVMEHAAEAQLWGELLLPERHGRALPIHDPEGLLDAARRSAAFDSDAHRARIAAELARIRDRRTMLAGFGAKELARGRTLDAHWVLQAMVVAPLVTLLGMRHRPLRYDYALRYLHEELPADVVARLVPIVQPGVDGLATALETGVAWLDELLVTIDPAQLPIEAHAAQMRARFAAS